MNILVGTFSFPDPTIDSYDGRFVFSEVLGYARNGAAVRVITPHYPGAARNEMLRLGIRIHRFRYFLPERLQCLKVPGQPIYRARSLLAIIQIPLLLGAMALTLLRHAQWADIIHAQWTVIGLLALPAKWLFGKPMVVTARGSDLRLLPDWLNRFLHRHVDAAIDCFGPQPWNDDYKRMNPAHFLTLPLIADPGDPDDVAPELDAASADPENPLIVLYIGRFDRIKLEQNHLPLLVLIEAISLLTARGVSAYAFYLGDGEHIIQQQMIKAITGFGIGGRVSLLGPRSNVASYVRACHIGVGGIALNGVVHDFTVAAKPQILMDTPENTGFVWQDGVNSLLVQPNDPVAMADRLEWAARHRDELRVIGNTAKDTLRDLVADTQEGGRHYLQAFAGLLRCRGSICG